MSVATKKALREERKSKGLCIHCGAKAKENQTRCQRCVDRDKANRKRYAVRDSQRGICRNTGCSNKVTGKKRYCDACNIGSAARTAARRKKRIAVGLCGCCGKQPLHTQTRCVTCTKKLNDNVARLTARRAAAGLCGRCGTKPKAEGYKRCQACIDEARERHNARKRRVMDAYGGPVCVGCGEDDIRILQLDHIHNNGHRHAVQIGDGTATRGRAKMYKWVEDNGYPLGFQVLCPNCNIKKARRIPFPNNQSPEQPER